MMPRYQQPYAEIIARHIGSKVEQGAITQFEGNDHIVLVVGGRSAFRFPKSLTPIDPRRAAFSEQLRSMVPLPVPGSEIHLDDTTGTTYETYAFIPGVGFDPALASTFSPGELMKIAQQLGAFLGAVHSFPIWRAREFQIDEMRPGGFGDYMERHPNAFPMVKRLAFPYLSTSEQRWVETLFEDFIALIRRRPFRTRVTHSDMWPHHIIVDPETHKVTGVIDFWGRIADPANDFKAFEYYGDDFVREVYGHYPLPRDANFEQRRLFYTGHDEVFQFARAIASGGQISAGTHQHALLRYIATHPRPLGV